MLIAVSTATLSEDTPTALERAAELGFRCVEINLQPHEFGYDYRRKTNARFYRRLKKLIDDLGLTVWSTTTPPLNQLQMFSQRARREILLSSAIAAGLMGSRVFVTRYSDIFGDEDRAAEYFDQDLAPPVITGYDEAWVQAVNRRTVLAVRNTDDWVGIPLVNQPGRMDKLTSDLAIGWAMDLPLALKRAPLDRWLAQVGDRLAVAYAYDLVDGEHRPPLDDAWDEWLATLGQTRLKCAVITGDRSDPALVEESAHRFLELST